MAPPLLLSSVGDLVMLAVGCGGETDGSSDKGVGRARCVPVNAGPG